MSLTDLFHEIGPTVSAPKENVQYCILYSAYVYAPQVCPKAFCKLT